MDFFKKTKLFYNLSSFFIEELFCLRIGGGVKSEKSCHVVDAPKALGAGGLRLTTVFRVLPGRRAER